jgi:eukaryotic-like serine/threonine-protein kinase
MLGNLLDGRYRVTQVLSAGGFGETYISEDTRRPGNPRCVLKVLKPASHDPEYLQTARRLFVSEAETLEQLGNHDQIPRLLAYFEEDEQFYLVQELIAGHPLNVELSPGQVWSEAQVISLLQDVLLVLEFVHGCNVIHRDIKPANLIRRNQDNKLVLIDFGAVKQIRTQMASPDANHVTVAIGTPGYMPPEQAQGRPRFNSDLYALGMVAIQALTGRLPHEFQEDAAGEVQWRSAAAISPALATVLQKMVRYHYRDRYQSARDVLQDLQQLTAPFPSTYPASTVIPDTAYTTDAGAGPFAAAAYATSGSNPIDPHSATEPVNLAAIAKLNKTLEIVRFVPFVGALGLLLFGGQTWIILLGVGLIVAGVGLFFLRSFFPTLARDYDTVFAVILALGGILLLFQDDNLKSEIQFAEFLLASASVFMTIESIRSRRTD